MTPELLYILGTLATWVGWVLTFKAASATFRYLFKSPGVNLSDLQRGMVLNGLGAGALLLLGALIPKELGRTVDAAGARFPLVWVLMPWSGWAAVACAGFAILRAFQTFTAITSEEQRKKLIGVPIWLVLCAYFWWLTAQQPGTVSVFRGGIPMSLNVALGIVALAIATLAAMAWISRKTTSRGYGKTVASHAALLIGSLIFGVPFAWLVVTSFKEDKDIANATALHWTPYITVMDKYEDPDEPNFQGKFQNSVVEGSIIAKLPDGRVRIDINKPMAMRGTTFEAFPIELKQVPKEVPEVTGTYNSKPVKGIAIKEMEDGSRKVLIQSPPDLKGTVYTALAKDVENVRKVGLRWQNFTDALDYLPPDTQKGLVYLKNTMILVVMSVIGTVVSCTLVAYAFSRMQFYGQNFLFLVLLSTMMLPGAVTMLPGFLVFRTLGWIDTLYPLWVPSFFAGAFNVFLLRQFFGSIPMELEDAAKIDGCTYLGTLWSVMVPQIKPALAAISIFTAMGAWNNFFGPLIFISSPDKMPVAYAVQLYNSSRGGEPGLLMAFTTMSIIPVVLLFFLAQRYFIEGVTLSGLGGR
ncbi:MAG: carbohydrate ABC transporter permease [Armatimonadetes bacterium]|nr:carbohydrate ABC transporter permease [Armatimonadota bacterium]